MHTCLMHAGGSPLVYKHKDWQDHKHTGGEDANADINARKSEMKQLACRGMAENHPCVQKHHAGSHLGRANANDTYWHCSECPLSNEHVCHKCQIGDEAEASDVKAHIGCQAQAYAHQ